jgi:sugar phosphate permease
MIGPSHLSYRWVVLFISFITLVLGYAIRNCFSVFYPAIVEEFGWLRGNTALIFSINLTVYGLMAPVAGVLVDRFRPRVILPIGAIIMGGGIALCSTATTQWEFFLYFGFLVACGLSLSGWTPLTAIVSNWFAERRALGFGFMTAGFGCSLIYATVAQQLITSFGSKTAYVLIGGSSILVIVPLCLLFMRLRPKTSGSLPDAADRLDLSSDRLAGADRNQAPQGHQKKWAATRWTLSRALKTHQFWLLFFIGFFFLGISEQIAIAHQVYFFRDAGYEPMLAANIYSLFGIAFVAGNFCSFFSDRLGREKIFIPGCLLCALATVLLFFVEDPSRPWIGFLFAALFGLGLGAGAPVFFTTVADLFHGEYFGTIQGTVVMGCSLGGALSPWLAGMLHDQTGTYHATYLLLIGSMLICILLMRLAAPSRIRPVARPSF